MRRLVSTAALILLSLSLCQQSFASSRSREYSRLFWMPEYHGEQLAYCAIDGACGMDVAMRYCKLMGFEKADQEVKANNIGLANYIDSRFRCKGWQCNGFKYIRCVSEITHEPPSPYHYRLRRYVYPRFGKYRVDWCYDGSSGCGAKAANSFCRRLGYLKANHYRKQERIAATKAIGNQKLCFGNECNAFKEIDCFR